MCILQYTNNIALSLYDILPELIRYKLRRNGLIKLFSEGLGRACARAPRPLGAPRSTGKARERARRGRNGQKYGGKAAPGTLAYGPDPQNLGFP